MHLMVQQDNPRAASSADPAFESTLRVFHTQYDFVPQFELRPSADVLTSPRYGTHKHEPILPRLPTRPDGLTVARERAADFFDEHHIARTEQAGSTLARLAHGSADILHDTSAFSKELWEVRRSRYRVNEGPQALRAVKAVSYTHLTLPTICSV